MNKKQIEALIYKPAKSAMQSGYLVKDFWELKFLQNSKINIDPLMGWSGSSDTRKQIILKFQSCDEAIEYAENNNISYKLLDEKSKKIKPKSYADNFSYKRKGLWTH